MDMFKVNETCRFTFVTPFDKLDGIYVVMSNISYLELIESKVDLQEHWKKCGIDLTEDDFENNYADHIKSNQIYKLVNIKDKTKVIYMSSYLFSHTPDPTIKQYEKYALGVNLDVYENVSEINWIADHISQVLEHNLGITSPVRIFKLQDVWLNEKEYKQIDDKRKQLVTNPPSTHFKDKQILLEEIKTLKTKLKYYEDKFKILGG